MTNQPSHGGFWTSLPGVLTGIAAVMTASVGLVLALGGSSDRGDAPPSDGPVATAPANPPAEPRSNTSEGGSSMPAGIMGPLEPGISYSQGDIYDRPATSAEQCVQLCSNDNRCRAVTYIISQQRCWLKDRVNPTQMSSDMISAKKLQ